MDDKEKPEISVIAADGDSSSWTTTVVTKNNSTKTENSNKQRIVLENGVNEVEPQSKICESNESSEAKCSVKHLGDSFCKSEETPTNDVNILSQITEETKPVSCDSKSGDKDACDGHSDSVETLEDVSSNDDTKEEDDSFVQQSNSDKKSCDTVCDSVTYTPIISDSTSAPVTGMSPTNSNDASPVMNGAVRPLSLSLVKSHDRNRSKSDDQVKIKDKRHFVRKERAQSDTIEILSSKHRAQHLTSEDYISKSLPKGTIMRKGDLIEFVASDLEEKIRHSSPISLTGSSVSSRRSSMRSIHSLSSSTSTSMATSTASGISRSPSSLYQQSPDDIPPIDPQAIIDLENQARLVADSIDLMMGNLKGSLHKMSAISVGCLEAYQRSVDITCDSVDSSIKSMYALMAKCEELSHNMKPIYQLAHQIKEIKRLLDLFEAQLSDK